MTRRSTPKPAVTPESIARVGEEFALGMDWWMSQGPNPQLTLSPERAQDVAEWFDAKSQEEQLALVVERQRDPDQHFRGRLPSLDSPSGVQVPYTGSAPQWWFFTDPNPRLKLPDGYVVGVRVTYDGDAVARLGGLIVDWTGEGAPPPIPAQVLRALPLAALVQEVHTHLLYPVQKPNGARAVSTRNTFTPPPGRPYGGSVEFSERVAQVYREGAALGAPQQAVAKFWGVSAITAERWVREARERGVLEHSSRSRKPEQTDTTKTAS